MLVLTLPPSVALIPAPVLAAIVIHAVSHTLSPAVLWVYFRWHRDCLVVLFAIAAVLLLGVLPSLLAAVGASLLMTPRDLSRHQVSVLGRLGQGHDFVNIAAHPLARQIPGVLVVRPETLLFFANVEPILTSVRQRIETLGAVKALILSLEESPDLDGTSIESLMELVSFTSARGIELLLARLHEPAMAVLAQAAIPTLPTSALTNWSVDDAVSSALVKLMAPPASPD